MVSVRKLVKLLSDRHLMKPLMRHRVAPAVEHLEAIRLTKPASLIDIGANKGQFSLAFRRLQPVARIIAFEPLPDAADTYTSVFARDPAVTLKRTALAEQTGQAEFHVTNRRDSSSLLRPGQGQKKAFGVKEAAMIQIPINRLDECVNLAELPHPRLIKIDVQGGELGVLKGSSDLEQADFIYVELSFVELYEGQPLFSDVTGYLSGRGFEVAGVFNQAMTRSFGPTQADVLFRRASARTQP